MHITSNASLFLIIDDQVRLLPSIYDAEKMLHNTEILIQ